MIKSRIPFDVSLIRDGVFMGLSAGPMGLVLPLVGLSWFLQSFLIRRLGKPPSHVQFMGIVDIHWVICGQSVGKWRPSF